MCTRIFTFFSQDLGRDPTEEEVAAACNIPFDKFQQILTASRKIVSLEAPVGGSSHKDDANNKKIEDMIDAEFETPEDHAVKQLLREDLENVLNTLSPRERDVLILRYGLDDGSPKTLEDIGKVFRVTRERVRQIETKAIRKLKQPARNSILKE